ncbi:CRISPR-associated protein [Umezakia ovalisporum]|jgi:putative CRISPR-associated protein (TIGR02619 family)|uniref:CRISPR-associated protein n=1 Tax=Umezakia ovalisporum TaxID=75695 RepID=UPI00247644B8|nr:CRISPR-associated protein [Umezakia ovalisporum]MDH6085777.1 CRISPR-associated protein [Umezakia ovalisporum TAC611]
MRRVVISTIGTSLLTNQIKKGPEESEKDWYNQLRDSANLTLENTSKEVTSIVETLKIRAIAKLENSSIPEIRLASAELNGIYGLYEEKLEDGAQDIHWLISTDTAQGKATAEIVKKFLRKQGLFSTDIYTPPGLSTATNQAFSEGIDELLVWFRKEIIPLKGIYRICFNLVGSFKSLQGYLNTIGMFYAHEIIYIFEGKESNLITIPRLPIKVDESLIEPYSVQLALMNEGAGVSASQTTGISEALIGDCDGKKVLSTWGKLIWDESKNNLLSKDLLDFPRLQYTDTFRADYNNIRNTAEKVTLQQHLAKVSVLLIGSNGDTSVLFKPLDYTRYQGSSQIDHFRINRSLRISCKVMEGGILSLRYYGTHDHVQRSERL